MLRTCTTSTTSTARRVVPKCGMRLQPTTLTMDKRHALKPYSTAERAEPRCLRATSCAIHMTYNVMSLLVSRYIALLHLVYMAYGLL